MCVPMCTHTDTPQTKTIVIWIKKISGNIQKGTLWYLEHVATQRRLRIFLSVCLAQWGFLSQGYRDIFEPNDPENNKLISRNSILTCLSKEIIPIESKIYVLLKCHKVWRATLQVLVT